MKEDWELDLRAGSVYLPSLEALHVKEDWEIK